MNTHKTAQFAGLIETSQFDAATALLIEQNRAAHLVNPRDDYSWGVASDVLGYRLLAEQGAQAFYDYWQVFLRLFVDDLEPTWGHLHKGHLYFRLGLGALALDLDTARRHFEDSLAEDRIAAPSVAQALHLTVDAVMDRFPSHLTLCILERLDDAYFASATERKQFYQGLAPLRFDVIWDRKSVEESLVRQAIRTLVTDEAQPPLLAAYSELNSVLAQRLTCATLSLTKTFLELLLRAALESQPAAPVSLTTLIRTATARGVFPADAVRSAFQLVDQLHDELLAPGCRNCQYPMSAEAVDNTAFILKVLVDSALVEWGQQRK